MSWDGRDDLRVVMLDGEPATVSTKTVETPRPRRRWRELLLVLAAVLTVVSVGFLDDDGGRDPDEGQAVAETTTTSTRRTTTSRRPTTSTLPPSTTTTSWPQPIVGTGPMLPDTTGTTAALLHGDGLLSVIDLDTGNGCTAPTGHGLWFYGANAGGWIVGQGDARAVVVGDDCSTTELPVTYGGEYHGGYPPVLTGDTVWVSGQKDNEPTLIEHGLPGGEPTGRSIEVPRFSGVHPVAAGDRLVLAAMGDMTLFDPSTGARRPLGAGQPIAATAERLAFMSCPELECRLRLLDLATSRSTTIGDAEVVPWDQGAFSPDGRQLRVHVSIDERDPVPAIIDLRSGEVRLLPDDVYQAAFTADSEWLVGERRGRIVAFRPGSPDVIELPIEARQLQGLTLRYR